MPGGSFSPEFSYDATKPAGSTYGYDADNWLRSNEMHSDNAFAIEHYSPGDDPDASEDEFGRHDYITLKERAVKPDLSGSTVRTGFYTKSDGVYAECADGTEIKIVDLTNKTLVGYIDIPSGKTILFYEDTAVAGYTLVNANDAVVIITKGSGAGGAAGGAMLGGSSWSQSHTHGCVLEVNQVGFLNCNAMEVGGTSAWSYSGIYWSSGGNPQAIGTSQNPAGNTWRPLSYCCTMQTRN